MLLAAIAFAVIASWASAEASASAPEAASGGSSSGAREGFFDCTGSSPEHAIRRAYRHLLLQHHPDKGGDGSVAADLTKLRDSWLKDPLRFEVFRAMFDAPTLHPFSGRSGSLPGSPDSALRGAQAAVTLADGWPYLQVEAAFDHAGLLATGGSWTLAFGLKGVSTVHYKGDESAGGYDVCCDFHVPSRCQRRPVNESARSCQGADASSCSANDEGGSYLVSDCPLPSSFGARVRRPLHLNVTGQWGAALQVRDTSGNEVACVAFAFRHDVRAAPLQSAEAAGVDADPATADAAAPPSSRAPGGSAAGAPPGADGVGSSGGAPADAPAEATAASVSFKHVKTGQFCEDGADMLEGPVDDYGGLSPFGGSRRADAESSLFYGSRCREKCRKRPRCKFFTAYSSGWCQLSTRCSRLAPSGDPLTVTFGKVFEES
eukprot:TRINITY_DN38604_c0_g1_i1.p1 TRINITY_DN38604_c0_g1~~TRINITY_DN38604_c0_g1_i1.p1  ORF type:complete len:432 (-),score=90.04 TRINITY_DN38604_c0_g1_i1:113-1408(-)